MNKIDLSKPYLVLLMALPILVGTGDPMELVDCITDKDTSIHPMLCIGAAATTVASGVRNNLRVIKDRYANFS